MTITIHGPDGSSFNFPDGTPQEKISTTLQAHYGAPKQSVAEGMGRAAATGVPIIGGLLNKADAATNAALAPIVDPLLPQDYEKLPEKTFGGRYRHALDIQNRKDEQFKQEHPELEAGSEIVGGLASTGAAATTATGAKLLGLTGETLPGVMARGAASGAGIGGLDTAVRGGSPTDIAESAGIGAGLGAAIPAAVRGASELAKPIAGTIRGFRDPVGEASRKGALAIDRDIRLGQGGLTPQELVAARASGLPTMNMDIGGPVTREYARSAGNTSPEANALLEKSINERYEGQADRLTNWLRKTFHYPDADAIQGALDKTAKSVNKPAYAKAYQEGINGIWSPELERLAGSSAVSGAMKSAVKNAGDEAVVSGYGAMNPRISFTEDGRIQFGKNPKGMPAYPDLQFWDLTRRELSDAAMRAPKGSNEARRLKSFASSLNAELDRIIPSYKTARSGAAAFFDAGDALEAGQKAVTSKMQNSQIRAGLAKMSPTERQLFQDGFVHRYIESIREAPDRHNILNRIANSPAARERLTLALGPQKAKELNSMLRVESVMDAARKALGNSTTMRQLANLGLAGGVDFYEGGGHFTADPSALLKAAMVWGAAQGQMKINQRVAEEVARLLTSNDTAALDKGIKLLANHKPLLGALTTAEKAITAAGRGAAPQAGNALGLQ